MDGHWHQLYLWICPFLFEILSASINIFWDPWLRNTVTIFVSSGQKDPFIVAQSPSLSAGSNFLCAEVYTIKPLLLLYTKVVKIRLLSSTSLRLPCFLSWNECLASWAECSYLCVSTVPIMACAILFLYLTQWLTSSQYLLSVLVLMFLFFPDITSSDFSFLFFPWKFR